MRIIKTNTKSRKYIIAILYNYLFNNKFYEFLYLVAISTLFFSIISLINNSFDLTFLAYLHFISLILSITTNRLSDVVIYSTITKHLSMNLKNIKEYEHYNYDDCNEKEIIAKDFRDKFIDGIIYAGNKKYKKIRLSTHKWVINNVLNDDRIKKYYNIEIKESGTTNIVLEMLLLANGNTKIIKAKRKGYKVILTLRNKL